VSAHRALLAVGPATIRRLCCGAAVPDDPEMVQVALDAIDDALALLHGSPVGVDSLWRTVLGSLNCASGDRMVVLHPTWWSTSRVDVVIGAAKTMLGAHAEVVARPRSWLLRQSATGAVAEPTVVVEIAERLVAIAGAEVVAIPRTTSPRAVAEGVAEVIARLAPAVVLIDAPCTIAGAPALAALVTDALQEHAQTVVRVDEAQLTDAARLHLGAPSDQDELGRADEFGRPLPRVRGLAGRAGAAALAVAAVVPAVAIMADGETGGRHSVPVAEKMPTIFLVEGRVALTVPANWPTQRVVAGPGSARVQVASPSDSEVALHVTQSPAADDTLSRTAERLKRAIDAEPAGVFVDFNPQGISAGRPAVTYREVRAGHQVQWTVLLDGAVRISVGCQSRPGGEDAVRDVCDQAVRSAHTVG
jgi:type VII secretion-associated protein (TIGR03931 family)